MRKFFCYLLAFGILLLLCACGEEPTGQDVLQIYGINSQETKVEAHPHEMQAKKSEERLHELIQCLQTNPEKLEYKVPFAMGFQMLELIWENGRVMVNVDADYLKLSATTEVLVRAAIVRTLTQLEGVGYVGISVEGNQLYDSTGSPVGWMSADQFIDNDGNEINTYEQVKVKLYFADESGTNLIAAYREKYYSTNVPLERFVVDELLAGPSGKVEGLYPTMNPSTKVVSVMTKDGICYVNLDDSFLTVVNNVSTDVAVYSIVNSLVELSTVNKVQILINGEIPASFQTSTFERNLDIVTTLESRTEVIPEQEEPEVR